MARRHGDISLLEGVAICTLLPMIVNVLVLASYLVGTR